MGAFFVKMFGFSLELFEEEKKPSLIYQCVFTKYKLFSPYRTLCTREVDIGRLASH
jgi:hypothetical protein